MKTKITFALIASAVLMSFFMACALEEIKYPITVSFDSRGGTNVKPVTLERGQSLGGKYPTPTIDGAAFKTWYDGFNECTKDTKLYVDVTLVAHWEYELVTVTFDSNNGTPDIAPITVPKGSNLGVRFPSNPRRQGYTLDKWSYGDNAVLTSDTPITANIDATAQWRQLGEFTVTFNTGAGATTINSIKVYAGDCIDEWENRYSNLIPQYTDPVPPPATGRSFREWVFDPDGQNIIYTGRTPITRNTTLVAQWRYVVEEKTFNIDLSYCLTVPGEEYEDTVGEGDKAQVYTRHRGDNHPLLNYPLPTVTLNDDGAYVFTFSEKNSAIAIETSEELRALLLVANSVTVEVDGTAGPDDRLFRILIGNTITYAEGWNLTKNHSPDPMIPFEQLKQKDLVIEEGNREKKPDDVDYVFFQTNRIGATGQDYDTPTVATIKSIKITVR
ncbi:hypothetical protein R84B8_03198 [Treponema sp. R8-4-B8]